MTRMPWDITREMFLDEVEVEQLLGKIRQALRVADGRDLPAGRHDQLIVETLLFSGLRNSEFCRLKLQDTCLGHGQPALIVRGPRKDERTVYVPAHLNDLLRAYVREVRPILLPDGVSSDDLDQAVVFNEHRQPYERTGLYRRVVRILTAAGLGERASVQLLRHTYGYLAYLRTGGNLLFVQRQLGHAHPMVTLVYAKFVKEPYGDLADKVARWQWAVGGEP